MVESNRVTTRGGLDSRPICFWAKGGVCCVESLLKCGRPLVLEKAA